MIHHQQFSSPGLEMYHVTAVQRCCSLTWMMGASVGQRMYVSNETRGTRQLHVDIHTTPSPCSVLSRFSFSFSFSFSHLIFSGRKSIPSSGDRRHPEARTEAFYPKRPPFVSFSCCRRLAGRWPQSRRHGWSIGSILGSRPPCFLRRIRAALINAMVNARSNFALESRLQKFSDKLQG